MTEADIIYTIVRVLTCGIWLAAAGFKIFHFEGWADKLTAFKQPFPRQMAVGVVVIELGGSLMVISNTYVWAVALGWIAFVFYGSYVEHRHVIDAEGNIDFHEYVQVSKNVSIVGGLLALILLDASRPDWLLAGFGL